MGSAMRPFFTAIASPSGFAPSSVYEYSIIVSCSNAAAMCRVASRPGPKYGECGTSVTPRSRASCAMRIISVMPPILVTLGCA